MTRIQIKSLVNVTLFACFFLLSSGDTILAQDRYYCEQEASDYARRQSREGGGVIRGSVKGAVGAGVTGRIIGGKESGRRAARAGAVIGGISGGVRRAERREEAYNYAFDNCMRRSY